MSDRGVAMAAFLNRCGWGELPATLLSGDASFRRYFRLSDVGRRAVVMDAPPPRENVGRFVQIARLLRDLGLSAPAVFAKDYDAGFLLIEDFGDDTYTRLLNNGVDEAALYALAVDALVALQRAVAAGGLPDLPPYDKSRLLEEASRLVDWYVPEILGGRLPDAARAEYLALWEAVLPAAQYPGPTMVLRDYHVDNLMLLHGREGVRGCGLLDFQDAVCGPIGYDLVSLLEDARRDVPAALRRDMTERYLAAFPELDRAAFLHSAAILAAQRNSKIIGLFTRLWRRDGKPGYLRHIPRVWRLLEEDLRHPALAPIAQWLDRFLPKALRRVPTARSAS